MSDDSKKTNQSINSTVKSDESEGESLRYHEWEELRPVPEPDISLGVRLGLWLVAFVVAVLAIASKASGTDILAGIALFPLFSPPILVLGPLCDSHPGSIFEWFIYPLGCVYYLVLTVGGLCARSPLLFIILFILFCFSLLVGGGFTLALMDFYPS